MGLKYYCNEKLFETWSPNMAYLLGYIYADGSLDCSPRIRGRYIKIISTDKELIDLSKSILDSLHKIVTIEPPSLKHRVKFLLRIGSHKIYNDLVKLGVHPNKSLDMGFPTIQISIYHILLEDILMVMDMWV